MLKACFTENSEVFAIGILREHGANTAGNVLLLGPRTQIQQQKRSRRKRLTRVAKGTPMAVSKTMPILIVDDYNTMIRILRNLLRQLGFSNIDEASDGRTALLKMKSKEYALGLSDWGME